MSVGYGEFAASCIGYGEFLFLCSGDALRVGVGGSGVQYGNDLKGVEVGRLAGCLDGGGKLSAPYRELADVLYQLAEVVEQRAAAD